MRIALALLITLALTAWGGCSVRQVPPVPAQCDAQCFRPCVGEGEDTGVRVVGDPAAPSTWDEIGGDVSQQLASRLRQCDVRRQACEQCLRRLDKHRVIQL